MTLTKAVLRTVLIHYCEFNPLGAYAHVLYEIICKYTKQHSLKTKQLRTSIWSLSSANLRHSYKSQLSCFSSKAVWPLHVCVLQVWEVMSGSPVSGFMPSMLETNGRIFIFYKDVFCKMAVSMTGNECQTSDWVEEKRGTKNGKVRNTKAGRNGKAAQLFRTIWHPLHLMQERGFLS